MLPFLFFLVFLLYDVQLVIPYNGIVLYRFGNCGHALQILFYGFRAWYCVCIGCSPYPLRYF